MATQSHSSSRVVTMDFRAGRNLSRRPETAGHLGHPYVGSTVSDMRWPRSTQFFSRPRSSSKDLDLALLMRLYLTSFGLVTDRWLLITRLYVVAVSFSVPRPSVSRPSSAGRRPSAEPSDAEATDVRRRSVRACGGRSDASSWLLPDSSSSMITALSLSSTLPSSDVGPPTPSSPPPQHPDTGAVTPKSASLECRHLMACCCLSMTASRWSSSSPMVRCLRLSRDSNSRRSDVNDSSRDPYSELICISRSSCEQQKKNLILRKTKSHFISLINTEVKYYYVLYYRI